MCNNIKYFNIYTCTITFNILHMCNNIQYSNIYTFAITFNIQIFTHVQYS